MRVIYLLLVNDVHLDVRPWGQLKPMQYECLLILLAAP